jgi:hypothetical protein
MKTETNHKIANKEQSNKSLSKQTKMAIIIGTAPIMGVVGYLLFKKKKIK